MENQSIIKEQEQEKEVYRISPEIGKYYVTTFYTRKTGSYLQKNEKYYTTNELIYVGKCIKHGSEGYGDNAEHWEIFENDEGKKEIIEYDYEGKRVFKEIKLDTLENKE